MPEEDKVFSSKIKYGGVFSFSDFYNFCHQWLTEETGLSISEKKYEEKLTGDSKNIVVEWEGTKKASDYFKFKVGVKIKATGITKVEISQEGKKIQTNKGSAEVSINGTLVKDYDGKFESSAFKKFLRSIYEKWVIASRIDQLSGNLAGDCDEFLSQAKAYLDLEGKK